MKSKLQMLAVLVIIVAALPLRIKVTAASDVPDVVRRLMALAEKPREELGDSGRQGSGQRPAGPVDNPEPQRLLRSRSEDPN